MNVLNFQALEYFAQWKQGFHPRGKLSVNWKKNWVIATVTWRNSPKLIFIFEALITLNELLKTRLKMCMQTKGRKHWSFVHTQQNSYYISYLLGTVTGSTVTTQLINCIVTVLPAVNNFDYTVTIQSLCSHCA